jgi:uncharacterized membrane protein YkvA (DUF1232 family)
VDGRLVVAVVLGLVALWAGLIALLWVLRPRDASLRDLVAVVPDVVRLVRHVLADPAVPLRVKVALAAALLWVLSPIDLIPEFIPVLGPLDDVVVVVVTLGYVCRQLGPDALRQHWAGTDQGFAMVARVIGCGNCVTE